MFSKSFFSTTPSKILLLQIVAHLSIIPMIVYGELHHYFISFFVYFLTGCFGMTMTYHRLYSHRCWNPSNWLKIFLTMISTIGLTGSALAWATIHRQHHAYSDTEKDPHSPKYKGFFYTHFLSMYSKVSLKFAKDLFKDKLVIFQHRYYMLINLIYALTLYFTLGWFSLIYLWLFPAAILWNFGSLIVSYSHKNGEPINNNFLGVLTWGEGWHKTHHTTRLRKWHKYDIGGFFIECIDKK